MKYKVTSKATIDPHPRFYNDCGSVGAITLNCAQGANTWEGSKTTNLTNWQLQPNVGDVFEGSSINKCYSSGTECFAVLGKSNLIGSNGKQLEFIIENNQVVQVDDSGKVITSGLTVDFKTLVIFGVIAFIAYKLVF